MKKTIVLLVMFTLATGAFAQKVSLDMHLSTYAYYPALDSAIVMPSIGVAVDVGPVDILGNFELGISAEKTKSGGSPGDHTHINSVFGINLGVAPKAKPTDKLTLSFPIFLNIYVVGQRERYKGTPPDSWTKKYTRGGFGFDAGARTSYAFSEKWSAYAGFKAELFSFYGKGKSKTFGGSKSDGNTINRYWFDTGSIDLGVTYTFN